MINNHDLIWLIMIKIIVIISYINWKYILQNPIQTQGCVLDPSEKKNTLSKIVIERFANVISRNPFQQRSFTPPLMTNGVRKKQCLLFCSNCHHFKLLPETRMRYIITYGAVANAELLTLIRRGVLFIYLFISSTSEYVHDDDDRHTKWNNEWMTETNRTTHRTIDRTSDRTSDRTTC